MIKNQCFLLLFLLLAAQAASAQKTKAELILQGSKYAVYENGGDRLPYREVRVKGDRMGMPALVVYLHGNHDRGSDNARQLASAAIRAVTGYLVENSVCSVVLAPQCPQDRTWNERPAAGARAMSDVVSAWLKDYISKNDIDRSRIYVVGVDEGGEGAWCMSSACPGMFAAAMAVTGMPRFADYAKIAQTPSCYVLTEHDAGKNAAAVTAFTDSVTACKGEMRLEILKGASHRQADDEAFTDDRLQWLLAHAKPTVKPEAKALRSPLKHVAKRKSKRNE